MEQWYPKAADSARVEPAAWSEFLSRLGPWECFATFTFRDSTHPEKADKLFRLLVSEGNRALHGPRWHRKGKGITWVRGLEYQRRDVIHYHALLKGMRGLRRLAMMDRWKNLAGFARIEAVNSQEAVQRYTSKYTIKDRDIDMGGPGIPAEVRTSGGRWPRGIPWYLSPLGRPDALARLDEVTTRDERSKLLDWAEGDLARRQAAPLLASVRSRVQPNGLAPDVARQVAQEFAEARRAGRRR